MLGSQQTDNLLDASSRQLKAYESLKGGLVMNIEILQSFVDLWELQSFTAAAKKEHLTQSAISKRVQALETELGIPLIVRSSTGMTLTPAGEKFFLETKDVLKAWNHAISAIDNYRNFTLPVLKVGYLTGDLLGFLPKLSNALAKCAPEVILELFTFEHKEILREIEGGGIDFALTENLNDINHDICEFIPLLRENCCVVTTNKSPLRHKKSLQLKDLINYNILSGTTSSSNYRDFIQNAFSTAGIAHEVKPVFNSYPEIPARLRVNNDTCILPSHLDNAGWPDDIVFIPLKCDDLMHDIGVLWNKSQERPFYKELAKHIKM